MFSHTLVMAAALMGLPSAYAHMIMKSPVPYGAPNNSPLDKSGSDFPCKIGGSGSYAVTTMNKWSVGSDQTLSFTGTAVHGGGSCQIVVTKDKEPTKSSKFKVIYSIEGGCPDPNNAAGTSFPFKVPEELPNGEMTMAWTWFNHIGNREMYMNCAPITVSGGTDDSAAFDGLPDMETANIGGDCKTSEGSDYTFKNPGKYSTRIGSGPFIPLCGGAPSSGTPPPPGGPQAPAGSQAPAVSTPAPAGSTPAPSAPAGSTPAPSAPAGSQPGLVTSTIRTMVTVTASFGQPTPAPSAPVAAPSGSAPAPSGAAPPASTGVPAVGGGGTCTTDGALICNGETEFGICNHGKVTFQPVAAGTKCQDGKIAKRDFKRDYTHRAQRTAF